MEIRIPTTDHVGELTDLWIELAGEQRQFGSHLLAADNRAGIREVLLRHVVADRARIAVEDEAVVGFVTFAVESPRLQTDATRGIVEHLYVLPERRDDGIGRALLSAAESALADRGVDAVQLEVMVDNEAARRFYRRHDYRPGRLVMEKPVENDTHSKEND